ncbi:MAG: hypothetical protein AAFM91_13565 [Pseudomonadota bacterium]
MTTRMAFGLLVAFLAVPAHSANLWSLYQPACASNGIGDEECQCIMKLLVERHGEDAARYVGLDMNLKYEEAAAVLASIGEDKAFAAGDMFDIAQNKDCSSSRLARQRGEQRSGSASAAAEATAAADTAAKDEQRGDAPKSRPVFNQSGAPLIDLRERANDTVIEVSAAFASGVLSASQSANMLDFVTFFVVVDENGGIDTDGDGIADLSPGDDGYAVAAQARTLPNKLTVSRTAGDKQYLGELSLARGALYAPLVRYRGPTGQPASPAAVTAADLAAMRERMRSAMSTNANLRFPFAAAHSDNEAHLQRLSENSFGVRSVSADGKVTFEDFLVIVNSY